MRFGWILDVLTFGYLGVIALVVALGQWGQRANAVIVIALMLMLGAAKFMVHATHRVTQFRIIWVAAPFIVLSMLYLLFLFWEVTWWSAALYGWAGIWRDVIWLVLVIAWLGRELWRLFRGRPI